MILLDRGAVKIAEVWFDDDLPPASSNGDRSPSPDLVQYVQRDTPYPATKCTSFPTILIDLSQAEEVLLAGLKKDARYAVRRAKDKDGAVCTDPVLANRTSLPAFQDFYNRFAAQKGLSLLDPQILGAYADAGALYLSRAATVASAEELVWHAYLCNSGRARLLYSASLFRDSDDSAFRQMVGRVNRLLHWEDMLALKSEGYATYDLGGWYDGGDDAEKKRINEFKEEFGGNKVTGYNCLRPLTIKGRLYLAAKGILKS